MSDMGLFDYSDGPRNRHIRSVLIAIGELNDLAETLEWQIRAAEELRLKAVQVADDEVAFDLRMLVSADGWAGDLRRARGHALAARDDLQAFRELL